MFSCKAPLVLILSTLISLFPFFFLSTLQTAGTAGKFHTYILPKISIAEYLGRIERYSICSKECFVIALLYIDRFISSVGPNQAAVNHHSIHRVLITSIMLAAKFYDDQYFNNAYYAKIGGLETSELNSLEAEFVMHIKFRLAVTEGEMSNYYRELQKHYNGHRNLPQLQNGQNNA